MIPPELAAHRFLYACLTGAVLGAVYGFLRPLRPRRTTLADGLFVLAALCGWLFLHFDLCDADVRIAYSAAMVLGGTVWEWTLGRLLRPAAAAFWRAAGRIWQFVLLPAKKFLKWKKIYLHLGENGLQ